MRLETYTNASIDKIIEARESETIKPTSATAITSLTMAERMDYGTGSYAVKRKADSTTNEHGKKDKKMSAYAGQSATNCGGDGTDGNVGQQLTIGRNISPNILTFIATFITFEEISIDGLHWIPHQQYMPNFFTAETAKAFNQLYGVTQFHKIKRAKVSVGKFMALQKVTSAAGTETTSSFSQNAYAIHVKPSAKTACFKLKYRGDVESGVDRYYKWGLPPTQPKSVSPEDESQLFQLLSEAPADIEFLGMSEVENTDVGTNGISHTSVGNAIDISEATWTAVDPSVTSVYNRGDVDFCYVGDTVDVSPNIGKQHWFPNKDNNNPTGTTVDDQFPIWPSTSVPTIMNTMGEGAQEGGAGTNVKQHEPSRPWNQHFFGMAPIKDASTSTRIGLKMSCVVESEMVIEFRFENYWQLGSEEAPDYHDADALRSHWRTQARQRPQLKFNLDTDPPSTDTNVFIAM